MLINDNIKQASDLTLTLDDLANSHSNFEVDKTPKQ
jgi:hypothetical protein